MKLKCYAGIGFLIAILAVSVRCADSLLSEYLDNKALQSELNAPRPNTWKVYWGSETNGIKAGLSVGYYSSQTFQYFSSDPDSIPVRCFPLLYDNSTNGSKLSIFDLPPLKSRYLMELTDGKGNAVQKTAKGAALGKATPKAYKPSPNRAGVTIDTGWRPARYMLSPKEARSLEPPFLLEDYFKITNSGIYHLHFEICAFKADINKDTNELIHFPPVNAEIEIKSVR